jgi:hypothetical protein
MSIKRDDRLRDSHEDQIGVSIPRSLNARLDALVDVANEAGENTSRKEIVAVLILGAPTTGDALLREIKRYRTAAVADAIVEGRDERLFLDPTPPRPGPRTRKRSS